VPEPLPLAPPVTVTTDVLLLTAVHAQPLVVVTVTLPVVAADATLTDVGLIE
jgi:hypothetical protein